MEIARPKSELDARAELHIKAALDSKLSTILECCNYNKEIVMGIIEMSIDYKLKHK